MKRKKVSLGKKKLEKIFKLILSRDFEEAKNRIPANVRHYPLAIKNADGFSSLDNCPLLHYAARYDGCDIVKYLLDGGADIELKGGQGDTPLITAARCGDKKCCKLLLDRGANINARPATNTSPLIAASCHGHVDICRLLVERGADIDACVNDGTTSLHFAVWYDRYSIIMCLLSAGAQMTKDQEGVTPLEMAKKRKNGHSVWLLENYSVSVNLSGVISRGLHQSNPFSDFLVFDQICDARLFIIVANFAYN